MITGAAHSRCSPNNSHRNNAVPHWNAIRSSILVTLRESRSVHGHSSFLVATGDKQNLASTPERSTCSTLRNTSGIKQALQSYVLSADFVPIDLHAMCGDRRDPCDYSRCETQSTCRCADRAIPNRSAFSRGSYGVIHACAEASRQHQ